MENVKLVAINTKIGELAKAEKITKKVLGELSRDMLEYVVVDEAWDSDAINRLLAVLTPMNKTTATHYFKHFTPFVVDDKGVFGGMPSNKKAKAKAKLESSTACTEFLVNEDANIWTWAEANLKIEPKEIDWAKRVTTAVQSAMNEEKGGMSLSDVMGAVLDAGIGVEDITQALAMMYEEEAVQDAVAEAA